MGFDPVICPGRSGCFTSAGLWSVFVSRSSSRNVLRLEQCKPVDTEENVQSKQHRLKKTNKPPSCANETGKNFIPYAVYKQNFPFLLLFLLSPVLRCHQRFWFCLFFTQNYLITKPITRLIFSKRYNYIVWPVMFYSLIFLDMAALSFKQFMLLLCWVCCCLFSLYSAFSILRFYRFGLNDQVWCFLVITEN